MGTRNVATKVHRRLKTLGLRRATASQRVAISKDRSVVSIVERKRGPSEETLQSLLSTPGSQGNAPNPMDELCELRYLALTDDLTCLYNRRGFFAAATQQLKLARRNRENLLLFFCDVDGLKSLNDELGHHYGDLAIACAAETLEKVFRDSDIIARLGGDEFAVLACEASSRSEQSILRRLHRKFQRIGKQGGRFELSLSVGVARFDPSRPTGLAELLAQADEAMYQNKKSRSLARRA